VRKWLIVGGLSAVGALLLMQLVPYRVTNPSRSEWGSGGNEEADDAAETVSERSMPPDYYTWLGMHADAKLTPAERAELAAGLRKTLGGGG
jgi:hypothetical protein